MGAARALLGLLAVAALAGGAVVVLEVAEHPPMLAQAPARRVMTRLAGRESLRAAPRRGGARIRARVQRHPARAVLGTPADAAPVPMGPLLAALEVLAGLLLVGLLCGCGVVVRLLWVRRHRRYALFELYLSTHDHAKPQDVLDMVESIANVVRAWPAARVWRGQPFVALELVCDAVGAARGGAEMEWSINVRCEPSVVRGARWCVQLRLPGCPARKGPWRGAESPLGTDSHARPRDPFS